MRISPDNDPPRTLPDARCPIGDPALLHSERRRDHRGARRRAPRPRRSLTGRRYEPPGSGLPRDGGKVVTTLESLHRPATVHARVKGLARAHYGGPVSGPRVLSGVVHKLPGDLRKALVANATALHAWNDITPLARNEFICWVEDAKQDTTRERRIRRTQEELEEGQRRPCCWPGCKHRERNGR